MNFAHKKLARFMPVLRFDDSDMLIRGHNDYNDSRQKDGVKPVTLAPMDAALADHVARRDADVRAVFSDAGRDGAGGGAA